jgi:hypothetical protein
MEERHLFYFQRPLQGSRESVTGPEIKAMFVRRNCRYKIRQDPPGAGQGIRAAVRRSCQVVEVGWGCLEEFQEQQVQGSQGRGVCFGHYGYMAGAAAADQQMIRCTE